MNHGHAGKNPSKTYTTWVAMRKRCSYPKTNGYHRYGGNGINVCDRWISSFINFLADMGECPSIYHSLDRYPNRKGNYEPGNCRWATRDQQMENMDKTFVVQYKGESTALFLLAKKFNINNNILYSRIRRGWEINTALITPVKSTLKWGIFRNKIIYVKSDFMYNYLQKVMMLYKIPLAKCTTHGLSKSIMRIKIAKYKAADKTYAGSDNPASKLIEGINTLTNEIKTFHGLKEAADYINAAKSNVANVISGASKTCKKWKFKHL